MMIENLNKLIGEIASSVLNELMTSEHFSNIIEKVISTGGFIDEKLQQGLNTFRVASKREMEDFEERIVHLEQKLNRVIVSIEELKEQVEAKAKKSYVKKDMTAICIQCGKKFTKKTFNQKYCSAVCRSKAMAKKVIQN